jgi:hypothetical protein
MGMMRRRKPSRNAEKIVLVVVLVTVPLATLVVRQFDLPDRLIEGLAIATIVAILVAGYVQYARRSRAPEPNVNDTDAG